MALNQIFNLFPRKIKSIKNEYTEKIILNWKYFAYLLIAIIFYAIFIIVSNLVDKKNELESQNFNSIVESEEFSNVSNFFFSKINSPYKEVEYLIQNNDSIQKILKKLKINPADIQSISNNLKERKLTNIYAGRKLSVVLKKQEDGSNTIVNLVYPVNNTLSIEVRKVQNSFNIKENILQLYKKEVVVKNKIKNNLYSAAVNAGIEPNIIIEFARIFGFEVDFQRDIRKGDWFEILYERFEDDNNCARYR